MARRPPRERPLRGRSRRRSRTRGCGRGLVARLHAGVAHGHAIHTDAVRTRSSSTSRPSELAMSTAPGVGVGGAHLPDGVALGLGGLVGVEHRGLAGLLDRLRQHAHSWVGVTLRRSRATSFTVPGVPRPRRPRPRRRAGPRRSGRRCARTRWCRLARRIPAPRSRPETPRPWRRRARRRDPAVLREHLGEVAASFQGLVQRASEHGFVDHDDVS